MTKLVIEIDMNGDPSGDMMILAKTATSLGTLQLLRELYGARYYNELARSTAKMEVK